MLATALSLVLFFFSLQDILRDSKQFKNGTKGSLENAFQMAYPLGSPRGHLRDKPQQEGKIEVGGKLEKKAQP